MWSRDLFTQTGWRAALLIGQILVLILCIGYIEYVYSVHILPDKRAKETFQQTSCFLISKKLSAKGHFLHSYRSDFLISYNVNGVQYNHWVSGNGLDMSFTGNETEQEDILSQFDVGGSYPCYYNPNNPQYAILVLRHNWLSTFPLMVPSLIFVITLYYLLKNVFQLLSMAKLKTNEMAEKKENAKTEITRR